MNRMDERRQTQGGVADDNVKSMGTGISSKEVESHNVIGDHQSVTVEGAEGVTDMASSKANRKEAGEPERENAEEAAMESDSVEHDHTMNKSGGRAGAVSHKNTMGYGERPTKSRHTI